MKFYKTFFIFFLVNINSLFAQTYTEIPPIVAEGYPIVEIKIFTRSDTTKLFDEIINDSLLFNFKKAFGIQEGSIFNPFLMNAVVERMLDESFISSVEFHVYNAQVNGAVYLHLLVTLKDSAEIKIDKNKHTTVLSKFPVIYENDKSKLTFIINGALGLFNDINAFHGEGSKFTQGNPIATDPANKGVRFWSEAYVEPGLAGITRIAKSNVYVYGAISFLISGRNTSDVYSLGPAIFGDFERLYAGILLTRLTKKKNLTIDLSIGRNFFQLNDAFLISRISGSSNAGPRASVYLSSRTAFQKSILLNVNRNWFKLNLFFLEPEDLFKDKQVNMQIVGGYAGIHVSKKYEIGLSYVTLINGSGTYSLPEKTISKTGMYILNPKIWLLNIASTGVFLKTEYAYQSHRYDKMNSHAWYVGVGYKTKFKWTPTIYYRFAYMGGDNPSTSTYERFDPLLTGGLGNWIQGINFRKILGQGNVISHRIQLQSYFTKCWDVSLDYFLLQADDLNNIGGLAPISSFSNTSLGQEVTMTSRYFINTHFLFLGILSYSIPGKGINENFSTSIYDWSTIQAALFIFY